MPVSLAKRGRGSARIVSQRRRRSWSRQHSDNAVTAAQQLNIDALSDFKNRLGITGSLPGYTIGGGWLQWAFTAAADVTAGSVAVRVGIIVTDESTGSEVPSLQGLGNLSDWMWYQVGFLTPQNPRTVLFDGQHSPMIRWRSQRRMDEVDMRLWVSCYCEVAGNFEASVSTVLINP